MCIRDSDFHHTRNSGNFGSPMHDWLFGTMDLYLSIGGEEGYCAMAKSDLPAKSGKGRRGE